MNGSNNTPELREKQEALLQALKDGVENLSTNEIVLVLGELKVSELKKLSDAINWIER